MKITVFSLSVILIFSSCIQKGNRKFSSSYEKRKIAMKMKRDEEYKRTEKKIEKGLYGKSEYQAIEKNKIRIINPGFGLNTDGYDYGQILIPGSNLLLFTSDRDGSIKNSYDRRNSHDIWMANFSDIDSLKVSQVINIDPQGEDNVGFNSQLDEGSVSVSPDGREYYQVVCNRDWTKGKCDIARFDATLKNNSFILLSELGLVGGANSREWESMPAISQDLKKIFFCSNYNYDKDKNGARSYNSHNDICMGDYSRELSKASKVKGLPHAINSEDKEFSPFICQDNKTMIFASDGLKPNYGGLDLYYSVRDSDWNWSKPKNLGPVINTEDDEFCPVLIGDGDRLLFSSDREDHPGAQGGLDIFLAHIPRLIKETTLINWYMEEEGLVFVLIKDKSGKVVQTIDFGTQTPGVYNEYWDGEDLNSNECPAGIYYYSVCINGNYDPERLLVWKLEREWKD